MKNCTKVLKRITSGVEEKVRCRELTDVVHVSKVFVRVRQGS